MALGAPTLPVGLDPAPFSWERGAVTPGAQGSLSYSQPFSKGLGEKSHEKDPTRNRGSSLISHSHRVSEAERGVSGFALLPQLRQAGDQPSRLPPSHYSKPKYHTASYAACNGEREGSAERARPVFESWLQALLAA